MSADRSIEVRLHAALLEYVHTVQGYIDFAASCGYNDDPPDHEGVDDLVEQLVAIDERLQADGRVRDGVSPMTDRERLLCDAIFAELVSFADTHGALRAGRGNSDDLRGFVGWLRSLAKNEPERLIG